MPKGQIHADNDRLEKMRQELASFHTRLYSYLAETAPDLKSGKFDDADCVDMGILMRDCEELSDELRKEAKSRKELCGRIIAMRWAERSLTMVVNDTVKGNLGSASPDTKQQGKVPERGSGEYFALAEFLGVPKEILQDGMPLKFDWNGMERYLTDRAKRGLPTPPGVTRTYPVFVSVFRRNKIPKSKNKEVETSDENVKF
jgi:hypothetical protein